MFRIINTGKINLTRGDSCEFSIELRYCDGTIYIPSANDIVLFTVKKKIYDTTPTLEKRGLIIHITSEDTKNLPLGLYLYDIKVLFEDGDVQTVFPLNYFELKDNVGDWNGEDQSNN